MWIVGYWHMASYIQDDFFRMYLWDVKHMKYITICVLSTFTFLSGYFLKKYQINTQSDFMHFYKRRLQRFWIPFFISALTLHVASLAIHQPWFHSHWHFLATVLGVSIFTPPSPGTIWYISMLMTFYMITPFILYLKSIWRKLFVSVILVIGMDILVAEFDLNIRVTYYLPVYLASLLIPSSWIKKVKNMWPILQSLLLMILFLTIYAIQINWITIVVSLIIGPVCLISISQFLDGFPVIRKFSDVVSYSSMNMYLFHRHIYMILVLLFSLCGIGSFHGMKSSFWLLLFIALPIVILLSFYLQRMYDKVCKRFS